MCKKIKMGAPHRAMISFSDTCVHYQARKLKILTSYHNSIYMNMIKSEELSNHTGRVPGYPTQPVDIRRAAKGRHGDNRLGSNIARRGSQRTTRQRWNPCVQPICTVPKENVPCLPVPLHITPLQGTKTNRKLPCLRTKMPLSATAPWTVVCATRAAATTCRTCCRPVRRHSRSSAASRNR